MQFLIQSNLILGSNTCHKLRESIPSGQAHVSGLVRSAERHPHRLQATRVPQEFVRDPREPNHAAGAIRVDDIEIPVRTSLRPLLHRAHNRWTGSEDLRALHLQHGSHRMLQHAERLRRERNVRGAAVRHVRDFVASQPRARRPLRDHLAGDVERI